MKPETYWTPDRRNATTFGTRTAHGWEFHYQHFKSVGNSVLERLGVHPVKTRRFSMSMMSWARSAM